MKLVEQIKKDLVVAMKGKDEDGKRTIRILLGELQRVDPKLKVDDEEVIEIIQSLLKAEDKGMVDKPYFDVLRTYLPKQLSINEIKEWIFANVNFSSLNNKMQAIGIVKKHFGNKVDGKVIQNIIQNYKD